MGANYLARNTETAVVWFAAEGGADELLQGYYENKVICDARRKT